MVDNGTGMDADAADKAMTLGYQREYERQAILGTSGSVLSPRPSARVTC